MEDKQSGKQARKLYAEQLPKFISFCNTKAQNLKEDEEADMAFPCFCWLGSIL